MWPCHSARGRWASLVVAHGHALVYQPLHEGRGPGTRVWFIDGPEGVVHVEVAGDDYGDVLRCAPK